jgi:hypothetical protein
MKRKRKVGKLEGEDGSVGSAEIRRLELCLKEWERRNQIQQYKLLDIKTREEKLVTVRLKLFNGHTVWRRVGERNKFVGIWYPNPKEVRECCQKLKSVPSLQRPYLYQDHCRTLKHCAMLAGLDPKEVKSKKVRDWWALRKETLNG